MEHQLLTKGGNAALLPRSATDDGRVHAVVRWSESGTAVVDVAALLLGPDGRARGDEDFVFYNAPVSTDGSVRLLGKRAADDRAEDRVVVDLGALSEDVPRVLIAASLDAAPGTGFGDVDDLSVEIRDVAGSPCLRFDITEVGTETAMVLGELYLRGEEWKFRAIGQGWDTGLAGLATDYGIAVDESSDDAQGTDDSTDGAVALLDTEGDAESAEVVAIGLDGATKPVEADLVGETDQVELPPSVDEIDLPVAPFELTEPPTPDVTRPGRVVRSSRHGVKTRKKRHASAAHPTSTLAADPSWQPARLFSVVGVGAAEEKERRATSALLSTMMDFRDFGRALVARFGGPAGSVEAFIEVAFKLEDRSVIPDGVIRVARAGRLWTALLEVKTGDAPLRNEQIERYLDLARQQGYDAVVTLSNDLAPVGNRHPVVVDGRKLRTVSLHHISWSEVMHEAQMQVSHRGLSDRLQAWVLAELVRYLRHPASGAAGFDDMGAAWVPIRDAVAANTLRPSDGKIGAVTASWEKLIRHLALTMTSTLGVAVTPVQPRKLVRDHAARAQASAAELAGHGTLSAVLRVPGAAGTISVVADLRTAQIRTSILVEAPREGGGQRRVNWILRQLVDAPDVLAVEVLFARREQTACELLRTASTAMGPKSSGGFVSLGRPTGCGPPANTSRNRVPGTRFYGSCPSGPLALTSATTPPSR